MNIYCDGKNIVAEDVCDFDIAEILECGQCFNFNCLGDHDYELVAYKSYLHVRQEGQRVIFYDTSLDAFTSVWKAYFDLDTDYGMIKKSLIEADDRLAEAIEAKKGIRIIKQDFFETLISFIISQNNNIPRIKKIIQTLSCRYGACTLSVPGREIYAFPELEAMKAVTEEELRALKVGFRAPYIVDAVSKVAGGTIDETCLRNMSTAEARSCLMSIKGVGEKVANCVLLFGLGRMDAFPVDVWMKRIMEHMYFEGDTKKETIESFACEKFGSLAGYAQQYLFFYGKEKGIGR